MATRRRGDSTATAGSGARAARALRVAAEVPEPVEGVPWSGTVALPPGYRERGTEVNEAERRGVLLPQLDTLAELVKSVLGRVDLRDSWSGKTRLAWEAVNLYDINSHFVMPLTQRFRCSFMELVANEPQPPLWFVSHWWGTPFHQTQRLLHFHAAERRVPASSAYWLCTFANNQHDLSELSGDLGSTPFVKALLSPECCGTVALLDRQVMMLGRIWCVLEHHVSTRQARERKPGHFYDLAAWLSSDTAIFAGKPVPPKAALRMDLGDGGMREAIECPETGGAFPLEVSARGAKIDILKAQASRPEDRRSILRLIAGAPDGEEPPESCEAYDDINAHARAMFAGGALYRAALLNDLAELSELARNFPSAVDQGISDGATALYAAAWKNNTSALRLLLEARADCDGAKGDGATAVFVAAQSGSTQALQLLLNARADANLARRKDGVAPLFMAAQLGHQEELELLLGAKADVDALTAKGGAALHVAVQQGHLQILQSLLKAGADPQLRSESGATAMAMVPRRQRKMQRLLAEAAAGSRPASGSIAAPKAKGRGRRREASPAGAFVRGMGAMGAAMAALEGLDMGAPPGSRAL